MSDNNRRNFLKSAMMVAGGTAVGAAGLVIPGGSKAKAYAATPSARGYRTFQWNELPAPQAARDVEVLWQTPFPASNGMQITSEGMWMIDGQTTGPHGERQSHVYLCTLDGEVIRDFRTGGETPSGITHDGTDLWVAATYSRELVRVDAQTGRTISSHFTPGASVIYNTPWDPESRSGPLRSPEGYRQPAPPGTPGARPSGASGGPGQTVPGQYREGTGAHGMEVKDGKIWVAVPPSRMIYRIDPGTWTVEHIIPAVHKRPHGIGFEGDYLWESDSDVSTFYKRNPETGEVLQAIRLADDHPQPHGMTVWDGYIWWVDDVPGNSWVCRMRIPT